MASSVYLIHPGAADLSPMPREVKQKSLLAHQTGRLAVVFEEDDLVGLLRAAVEREGGQTAFAKRYKVDRSRVNRILSRQLRSSEAIAKALGLRRAYIAD
jgi:DNA-binding phage protein